MKIGLLVCALLFNFSLFAQHGEIKGKVFDPSGEAAMYANIVVHNPSDSTMIKGAVAEEDGSFLVAALPFDQYFISISYIGFAPYQSEVFDLNQKNMDLPTITLNEASNDLAEITVTAQRPMFEMKSDKIVFNVDGTINASGENALELLRKSPGVTLSQDDAITLMGKSGVKVYIDGKESPLSGDNLTNFLRSLQAEQLDAIEVITNASAEYDAEGSGGIINFRLKKDTSLGFNTGVSFNYSRGLADRYNGSINTNYRNSKFNVYAAYDLYDGGNQQELTTYRKTAGQIYDTRNQMQENWFGQDWRWGADWFVNDKHTVGIMMTGYKEQETEIAEGNTNLFQNTENIDVETVVPDSTLLSATDGIDKDGNVSFNLNYEFKDEKENRLTIDLDAGFYNDKESQTLFNTYRRGSDNQILNETAYELTPETLIDIYTAKLDYKRPWLGGNLGIGTKFSLVSTDNLFSTFNVTDNGKFIDNQKSNHFTYDENISAAYVTYSGEKDKFTYNLGLRAEQTNLEGILMDYDSNETIETNKQNYLNWFPSASLSYQVNEKNGFSLSYSRRINRPDYDDLNPFEFKIDELTFEKGNPFLQPEYANNFQVRHSFMQMVNTTLAYSRTKNVITEFVGPTEDRKKIFISNENLASQDQFSLNIASPIPIADWWSAYTSITAYHIHNKADFGGDKVVDMKGQALSLYLQNSFSLPHDISIEVSGWYNSRSIYGNILSLPMGSLDLGVQKEIFDGKGTIKVAVSDIFGTNRFKGIIDYDGLYSDVISTWDSRRVKIGFSYLFGNDQVKVRNRSTGLEDEGNRVK